MFSFSKKPDPKEQIRQWKRSINHEIRSLDRQIRSTCNNSLDVGTLALTFVLRSPNGGGEAPERDQATGKEGQSIRQDAAAQSYARAADPGACQNQIASVKTLARALVRSKKTKEQMHVGKAQLNSVSMKLQENLGKLVS